MTIDVRPTPRERRLFSALLTLGVIALFFIVVDQIAAVFFLGIVGLSGCASRQPGRRGRCIAAA